MNIAPPPIIDLPAPLHAKSGRCFKGRIHMYPNQFGLVVVWNNVILSHVKLTSYEKKNIVYQNEQNYLKLLQIHLIGTKVMLLYISMG